VINAAYSTGKEKIIHRKFTIYLDSFYFVVYNIFIMTNVLSQIRIDEKVAEFFSAIGQPVRVQILLVIGSSEACVCHLEAYLGLRQAAISQHLMVLREMGLVTKRRDGRNIYYRLGSPELLSIVLQAVALLDISNGELDRMVSQPVFPCPCPHCNPEHASGLDCSQIRVIS
jgi:DNA-binding transcriptional ArsR family regulator